ncbi:hypothetical protein V8E36_002965 [Tilletia maclaganii]
MRFAQRLIASGISQGVSAQQLYNESKTATSSAPLVNAGTATDPESAADLQQQKQPHANHFPSSPADYSWEDLRNPDFIAKLLADCVMGQYLIPWYTWTDIQQIAQRIATSGALAQVAEAWQLPPSLAADLVTLALFDVIMLLDDERSMDDRRREALRHLVKLVAEAVTRLSPNGLQLYWCNDPKEALVSSPTEAVNFFNLSAFGAARTAIGVPFKHKIIEPQFFPKLRALSLRRPVLILVITSERPAGSDLQKFCRNAKRARDWASQTKYGAGAISIQFTMLGDHQPSALYPPDLSAVAAMDVCAVSFDRGLESQHLRDSIGADLSPELWALKIVMTPIKEAYENFGWMKVTMANKKHNFVRTRHNQWQTGPARQKSTQFIRERNAALQTYLAAGGLASGSNAGPSASGLVGDSLWPDLFDGASNIADLLDLFDF